MTFVRNLKKGFSLMEVICVMIIISIVSSITLPAINSFHSSERVKAEADILVSYIRQARYQAIQSNRPNRIIFDDEDSNFFKVQTLIDDEPFAGIDSFTDSGGYDSNKWVSIADSEEIEINSSVEVDINSFQTNGSSFDRALYFSPDGYLYVVTSATSPTVHKMTEQRLVFRYGSAALAVDLNALGVISSRAYARNENENEDEEDANIIW